MPNHTYCMHTNWSLQKPLSTGGKEQCDKPRHHCSSKEFSGAMTVLTDACLSSYSTAWQKKKCFFSSIFRREKNLNPPNKAKAKIPFQWNGFSVQHQQGPWFQQNMPINNFVLGNQFPPVLKVLLPEFSGQILLSRFIQLQRFIYFNSLLPCLVEYMVKDSVYII